MAGGLKEKAARGFLWGGLNNGAVQVLGALFGIFLLRLLSPSDYGKIAMLTVFANLASTLQESGFMAALCNLKNPTHRDYNAVFWFNIMMGGSLYLLLYLCAPLIADFYHDADLLWLSRYMFLGFFITSFGTVQRAWLFRNMMNKQTCIIAIVSLVVSNVVGILMAWLGYAFWGLATQSLLFVSCMVLMNWYYSPWRPSLHIDLRPAWQMFGFSSRLLLTNVVNTLSSNAFSFLLGKFYGAHSAGVYGNARKWDDMCSSSINGMLTGVAQPVMAQVRDNRERSRQVFRKMLRFVSFVSFPCMFGIGLISREFLLIFTGPKWEESAYLLSLLSIYGAVFPLLTLYGQMVISQGRSNINMYSTMALSSLILLGLVLLHSYGLYVMVFYFIGINVAWLFVWQYFAYRLIGLRLWEALSDVLPFLLLSAACMALTWWITRPIESLWLLLLAKVVLAAVFYVAAIWISGARIMRESVDYLLHRHHSF
ncbi:MAG: lipopolysaccharide biosynthesis protein [Bacteroidaceae bacterium]|nr:lipopolysaccharide biosynthesis protein [Paraprevotella sp.]MDD6821717.1 lipopolysaccharide biosynthesis protein [Paraprevotella sp.]MDD6822747.1 lipopolysaccharide biosynthesis protein [Paraprevotella sp.]MDY5078531.1 lipopolysaccharide biosynthesis protein [Bacteroidaceae bacterium]